MWVNDMKKIIILYAIIVTVLNCCKAQDRFGEISNVKAGRFLWIYTNKPWDGTFNYVVELIQKGADVDFIHPHESPKQTPFLNAAGALECLERKEYRSVGELDSMEIEAVKIVEYLAAKGANIHATSTSRKLNALHLAACGGREKMIPVLVELGLDINSTDSTGVTTLIHAIGAGDLATVKAAVKAGADINMCTRDGNSPLDWAQAHVRAKGHMFAMPYEDQEAIVEYLQSIGAKPGKNDFTGMLYFDENKR